MTPPEHDTAAGPGLGPGRAGARVGPATTGFRVSRVRGLDPAMAGLAGYTRGHGGVASALHAARRRIRCWTLLAAGARRGRGPGPRQSGIGGGCCEGRNSPGVGRSVRSRTRAARNICTVMTWPVLDPKRGGIGARTRKG